MRIFPLIALTLSIFCDGGVSQAQMFAGGYGPPSAAIGGYPWPAFLPGPPPLPMEGVLPYNKVPPIDPQSTPVTCWAASMSNLFRFYGYDVPEQQIVQTIAHGAIEPANGKMMAAGMNRVWTDQQGRSFRVKSNIDDLLTGAEMQCDNGCIFNELHQGRPVLMGNTHHAMVIYAAMRNQFGSAYMMWVNDPAPMATPFNPNPMAPHPPRFVGSDGEGKAFFIAAASVTACPANGEEC